MEILGVILAIIFVLVGLCMWRIQPLTPHQEYQRECDRWIDDCRRRGLTGTQMAQELYFRQAWVRLRRQASDETLKRPAEHDKVIARIAKDEAMFLAKLDKDVARRFLKVVNTSPLGDILYDDAFKALRDDCERTRLLKGPLGGTVTEDMIAAVTLRRK
jgi:hypothetical protein